MQLVEVEQQTPVPRVLRRRRRRHRDHLGHPPRRPSTGTSSAAYAQFDNHNADGSRASFPLDVEDGDTYGLTAAFVRGPNFGVVQVSIDGRPLGAPFDGYAATLARAEPLSLGTLALSEGRHILTLTVTGKNEAATDYLAGLDLLVLDSTAAPVRDADRGGDGGGRRHGAGDARAHARRAGDVRGLPARRRASEYTASTTANVVSTAGDAALTRERRPAAWPTARFTLAQPLRVAQIAPITTWSDPVSNGPATLDVQAGDRGHRAAAHGRLHQDADVHALDDEPLSADLDVSRVASASRATGSRGRRRRGRSTGTPTRSRGASGAGRGRPGRRSRGQASVPVASSVECPRRCSPSSRPIRSPRTGSEPSRWKAIASQSRSSSSVMTFVQVRRRRSSGGSRRPSPRRRARPWG